MANSLSVHNATVVAMSALEVLRKDVVLPRLVTRDYEQEVKEFGEIVKVPITGSLVANDMGATVTKQDVTSTSVSITLNKHKESTFVIRDVEKAIARGTLQENYLKSAMTAIVEAVDADLAGLYTGLSTTVGAEGTPVTAAVIRNSVRKALSDAKAPKTDRFIVAGTELYAQLLGEDAFVSAEKLGAQYQGKIAEGLVGKVYGFEVFESQGIITATGDHNLAFQRGAFALVVRDLPEEVSTDSIRQVTVRDPMSGLSLRVTMSYNPDATGWQTTVEILYGVGELRDALAVDLIS